MEIFDEDRLNSIDNELLKKLYEDWYNSPVKVTPPLDRGKIIDFILNSQKCLGKCDRVLAEQVCVGSIAALHHLIQPSHERLSGIRELAGSKMYQLFVKVTKVEKIGTRDFIIKNYQFRSQFHEEEQPPEYEVSITGIVKWEYHNLQLIPNEGQTIFQIFNPNETVLIANNLE